MKGLVNVEKYGLVIRNNFRKDWAKSKKIFVRKSVAEALLRAKSFLPKGYNFEIHDGKRSIEDQRRIIKICEKDLKNKFPASWKGRLVTFTGGYKSLRMKLPRNTHRHGGAIDLTILDKNGKQLDMGGRKFNSTSKLNYYENRKNLTEKQKLTRKNRQLLKRVMKRSGFIENLDEWHHWGYSR
jgi:zinc D-Ala-D-Ala dipeptidase